MRNSTEGLLHLLLADCDTARPHISAIRRGAEALLRDLPNDSKVRVSHFGHALRMGHVQTAEDAHSRLYLADGGPSARMRDAVMAALHIDGERVATVATIVVVMCGEDCDSSATAEAMRALAKSFAHYQIMVLQIGRAPVFESVDASQWQYLSCAGDGLLAVVREVVEPVDEEIARGFGVIRRSLHQHARNGRTPIAHAPRTRASSDAVSDA